MCTRIRFLGWAPGSRVPSQAPTISGSPAAIMGSGMIANPGISVNPNQSPNDNARYLFMVDLLIELRPKSARSQSGIALFRCLSPTIAIEGRVPAARPRHAKFCQNPPLWHPGYHGEMQADTAVNPDIMERIFSFSEIKGGANILIFPTLDAGNIAYKLVQQLGGGEVLGPFIMGVRKPANVLQRTCTVDDIVNTI